MTLRDSRQLSVCVAAGLLAAVLCGCSKSPCQDPKGEGCGRTGAYADDDPRSVCHVCCESNSNLYDAWTELFQTDTASGHFSAYVHQGRPYPGQAQFTDVAGSWNGTYFSFDGQATDLQYHLFTRGRSSEGNLYLYFLTPGDGPVSAAPISCAIARN